MIRWWAQDCLILHPQYKEDLGSVEPCQLSFLNNISDVSSQREHFRPTTDTEVGI